MTTAMSLEAYAAFVKQERFCAATLAKRDAIHPLTALSRNPQQWESGRGKHLGVDWFNDSTTHLVPHPVVMAKDNRPAI